MGVNNKKRRAARERKRARDRARAGFSQADADPASAWDAAQAIELVEVKVRAAVRRLGARRLDDEVLAASAEHLQRSVTPAPAHVVHIVVAELLVHVTRGVTSAGWPPGDLAQLVRRHLGERHLPTLVGALHEEGRDGQRRDHAWVAAVNAVGPERPLVVDSPDDLASALGLAALLSHAPLLTDAVDAGTPFAGATDHPKLAQVRALLAKAESTDFEHEAEALYAKAQELITRYALGRLVGDQERPTDARSPRVRRIWLDAPYVAAKASLVAAVASANRCRTAFAQRYAFIVVVGAIGDLDAVELLTTSLLVQADLAMARHGSRNTVGGVSRTRSFRQSLLTAYASRIGERLREASESAARAGGHLPVLRSQEERVAEEFDRLVPHTPGRPASVSNGDGWRAGRVAADLAQLDVHRGLSAG
ncbi:hypothetical protein J2X46_001256 [Nocardioides sp. BE266]|uniref:DUF2786 domain-containing protein n=1 Tax=Nocardioides sp. BE266 TaxID=2817725 RepID=UPI002866EBBC|nr:DUF2786 domain-containing protein [Nocardioides sp. BE266]MDR7252280.1 hypothetical protein [Nocardioides sp. BE266]